MEGRVRGPGRDHQGDRRGAVLGRGGRDDLAVGGRDDRGDVIIMHRDVTVTGVYRVSADLGSMSLLTEELVGPNGLAFTPERDMIVATSSALYRVSLGIEGRPLP